MEGLLVAMNGVTLLLVIFGVVTVVRIRNQRDKRINELEERCRQQDEIHGYLRDQVAILARNSTIEVDDTLMRPPRDADA